MARGRRGGTLAALERELAELNQRRERLVNQIKAAVEQLTLGSAIPMGGLGVGTRVRDGRASAVAGAPRGPRRRNVSPAVRARLSALAKARWAKAKKEGKKRLG